MIYGASVFEKIISLENLFSAWQEFRRGKKRRNDLSEFEINLEDHLFKLHYDLKNNNYKHGGYFSFIVHDPKRRHIHKASVQDRLLHHAIVRVIEPIFDKSFIYDSWSCRRDKGIHGGVKRLHQLARKISHNNSRNIWALKLDIQKFFASVDHTILIRILSEKIYDIRTMKLIRDVIESFYPGMPLGNLTSQLFANVYMNELDQFVKHELKVSGYLRYSDDFVLLHHNKEILDNYVYEIREFLNSRLRLELHEQKIIITKYRSGIDFLGYVCFPNFTIIRTRTKKRMLRKLKPINATSYIGVLKHCRSYQVRKALLQKLRSTPVAKARLSKSI